MARVPGALDCAMGSRRATRTSKGIFCSLKEAPVIIESRRRSLAPANNLAAAQP